MKGFAYLKEKLKPFLFWKKFHSMCVLDHTPSIIFYYFSNLFWDVSEYKNFILFIFFLSNEVLMK